jgi:hypothetical protein
MVRSLGVIALGLLVTTTAHGEQPGSAASAQRASEGEPSCTAPASAPAAASEPDIEERAFSAELESFARRRAFTDGLVAQRNAELFEQAIARQARAAKLQRELAERERARSEREFEDAFALYLKKRELTRQLAAVASRDGMSTPSAAPASSPAP